MRLGKNSQRSVVSILRPGDLFGELFRPEGTPIEEMAVAAGEAEVWSIEGRDFRAQLEARPTLAVDVVRAYAERVRVAAQARAGPDLQGGPGAAGGHPAHPGRGPRRALPARRRDRPARHHPAGPGGSGGRLALVRSTLINEMKRDGVLGNVGRILCVRDQKALRKIASEEK